MIFGGHGADELKQGVAYMAQAVAFEPQNADAQFLLARAYQGGWGGSEKNAAKAFEHFLAASKLGDERAERYVGMARLNGQGTAKDPPAALADFRSAAAHGSVWAMIDIAAMLAVGEGVPADPPAARDWYRRAADLGSAHGVRGLGVMLYRGEGGAVDTANGRALLELAVEAGDADAKRLAPLLFQGREAPDRAAIDAAKAAWLQSHPPPKAD
jgi:TPR repeat protein